MTLPDKMTVGYDKGKNDESALSIRKGDDLLVILWGEVADFIHDTMQENERLQKQTGDMTVQSVTMSKSQYDSMCNELFALRSMLENAGLAISISDGFLQVEDTPSKQSVNVSQVGIASEGLPVYQAEEPLHPKAGETWVFDGDNATKTSGDNDAS